MSNKKIMIEVLGKCRLSIDIFKQCNANLLNIVLTILNTIIFSFTLFLIIWFCFDHSFNLNEVSFALPVYIGGTQVFFVCISLIRKVEIICETVNYLQNVVEKRKNP